MGLFSFFRRNRRVVEALKPDDDRGWTRGSAFGTGTPLNPDRDELHGEALSRAAYEAYSTNPLAYAIVEQTTSFVLGGGAKVVAKNPRAQKVVDRFWDDPDNDMPTLIYAILTELTIFGEQFIRFFVDPLTGRVVIRQLDPLYITAIETNPEDIQSPTQYLYSPPSSLLSGDHSDAEGGPGGSAPGRPEGSKHFTHARGSGGAQRPPAGVGSAHDPCGGTWIPASDILHISINKVSAALRGRSDLAPILPWLRRYTDWLENRARLHKLITNLLWDIKVIGGSQEDLARLRAAYATPPPPGTVLVHNDREEWKALLPEVHGGDAAPDGRAIRLMVATGAILPEHYLAEGSHANRATAAEMGLPTIKRFQRRQQLFRALLTRIVNRVLDEAVKAGRLGHRADRSFTVHFEELSPVPPSDTAVSLERYTRALSLAIQSNLVTPEDAQNAWRRFAARADDLSPQSPTEES